MFAWQVGRWVRAPAPDTTREAAQCRGVAEELENVSNAHMAKFAEGATKQSVSLDDKAAKLREEILKVVMEQEGHQSLVVLHPYL